MIEVWIAAEALVGFPYDGQNPRFGVVVSVGADA